MKFLIAFLITVAPFQPSFLTAEPAHHFLIQDQDQNLDQKLLESAQMADTVLEAMGLDLPEIVILQNSNDAYASNSVIYIGDQMIANLDGMTLTQIILHEAGHVFEGHTGEINTIMDQLVALGLMTPEQRSEILRNDELVADAYAAIGSWMLEPGVGISSFSEYMNYRDDQTSDTHPSSADRIEFVENLIDVLSAAEIQDVLSSDMLQGLQNLKSESASSESATTSNESTNGDETGEDPNQADPLEPSFGDGSFDGGEGGGGDGGGG